MPKIVTAKQAQAVIDGIKAQFADLIPASAPADYLPQLEDAGEWFCEDIEGQFVILWSEGAPMSWAQRAFKSRVDWIKVDLLLEQGKSIEEAEAECTTLPPALPEGIWVEPVNDSVLRILAK